MMAFGLQTYSLLWTDEISEQSLVSTCTDTIFNVIAQLSTNARSFTVSGRTWHKHCSGFITWSTPVVINILYLTYIAMTTMTYAFSSMGICMSMLCACVSVYTCVWMCA